jgi:shikimate kinase|tara:strand:- start:442 stop:948 length:507 start_codon:yes stop_codon:yes gene_type:complete
MRNKIYLIGSMGSGKTTIGKMLANKLHLPFIDIDKKIEQKEKMVISDIFKENGENYFRKIESDILKKYSSLNEFVISTGGGAVLSQDNKKILNNGYKIYLKISIDAQYNRVKHRKHRPLLIEGDLKTILNDLDEVRGVIYSDLADLVVDVSYLDKEDVLSSIMNQIEN